MTKSFSKSKIYLCIASALALCTTFFFYKKQFRVMCYLAFGLFITLLLSFLLWNFLTTTKGSLITANRPLRPCIFLVMFITILVAIIPMSLSPVWNGTIPEYRDQYEQMTDSLVNGHLYLDYDDIDPKLDSLNNPYDIEERASHDVSYHWDHAYYKGKYYMYFGVVPVFLFFLPIRLLTGVIPKTYHATQFFTALYIVGLFRILLYYAGHFFKKLSTITYLWISVAFSLASTWFITMTPALYCTAISSGLCMEIWSLHFFSKAAFSDTSKISKQCIYVFLGSLLGALAFGCRPPIALANIIAIPLLILSIKHTSFNIKSLVKIFLSLCPYIVVGVLLMLYNYARFENPFEFGQSYQLTVADQHLYLLDPLKNIDFTNNIRQILQFLFGLSLSDYPGLFVKFPILFFIFLIFTPKKWKSFSNSKLLPISLSILFSVAIIICSQIISSPFLIQRYEMDIMWLLCLCCFFVLAEAENSTKDDSKSVVIIRMFCMFTAIISVVLILIPNDSANNFTSFYHHEIISFLKSVYASIQ